MATRMDRPILASTAAKEMMIINNVVSNSAGVPRVHTTSPTVMSVIASKLSKVIRKCFR